MRQWLSRLLGKKRQFRVRRTELDPGRMPKHVAIIMDGNGRWAKSKGLPRTMGHKQGMEKLRQVVAVSSDCGIKTVTLYAFSTENWRRPPEEVDFLMGLPQVYLERELPELRRNNVRLCFLGRLDELPEETRWVLKEAVRETEANTGLRLNIAINYGGRAEIIDAVRALALQTRAGKLEPEEITEELLAAHMYTGDAGGDPDLLIRTGGEARVSNFLLWQIAYTELWFTTVLWPDFGEYEYREALAAYQTRERRFGRLSGQNG